jgi:hypothetical protein
MSHIGQKPEKLDASACFPFHPPQKRKWPTTEWPGYCVLSVSRGTRNFRQQLVKSNARCSALFQPLAGHGTKHGSTLGAPHTKVTPGRC